MSKRFFSILSPFVILLIALCLTQISNAQPNTWQRVFNGQAHLADESYGVCIDNFNSIYVMSTALYNENLNTVYRILIIKLNSNGDTLWAKYYGIDNNSVSSNSICFSPSDNTILFTGASDLSPHFPVTFKIDQNGSVVWKTTIEDSTGVLNKIKTLGNEYIACGHVNYIDGYLVKLDFNGNVMNRKIYSYGYRLDFYDILKVNNNYLVTGLAATSPGKALLMNLDSGFILISDNSFLVNNNITSGYVSLIKSDTLYVAGSVYNPTAQTNNTFIAAFNSSFKITKYKIFDAQTYEYLTDFIYDGKSKFILLDYEYNQSNDSLFSKIYTITHNFDTVTSKTFRTSLYLKLNSICKYGDFFIFTGGINFNSLTRYKDVVAIKSNSSFDYTVSSIFNNSSYVNNYSISQNYPNPFNPSTKISYSLKKSSNIELKLFDVSGRFVKLVQSGFKPAGSYEINFSSEGLSSGVYFISLFSEGVLADTKKAVLLK